MVHCIYWGVTVQGGTLIFSSYVGLDQASTVYIPKKYQEYQAPHKNIWYFCNPKKYHIMYIYLNKKRPYNT